jgi:SAM-dependent methyltransferase
MNTTAADRRRFLDDYRKIRYAEGRGSADSAYYRALPFDDLSGRDPEMWAMRARTYRYFVEEILGPVERPGRALDILDLGAGNAWLSYRLTERGHRACAIDIFSDPRDGLGAARHYPRSFPIVEADFSELPFRSSSFDMAVFNSSLHYSTDYQHTLTGVRQCLRPGGWLVVLDSPVYRRREHGELMVAERHAQFEHRYGTRSDAIASIEFLDVPVLKMLAASLGITWSIHRPWYGWRWHLRPLRAWLSGNRPPSRFWILAGRFGA